MQQKVDVGTLPAEPGAMNIVGLSLRGLLWVGTAFTLLTSGCAVASDEDDDADVEDVGETAEAVVSGCPSKATSGTYVLCVWKSKKGREKLTVFNRTGRAVKTGEVTTSNVDTGAGDSITCTGKHRLGAFQRFTSHQLENFFLIEGCGEQGVHYYDEVGKNADSHGCVRVKRPMTDWLRVHLSEKVDDQVIFIHIMPPPK